MPLVRGTWASESWEQCRSVKEILKNFTVPGVVTLYGSSQ